MENQIEADKKEGEEQVVKEEINEKPKNTTREDKTDPCKQGASLCCGDNCREAREAIATKTLADAKRKHKDIIDPSSQIKEQEESDERPKSQGHINVTRERKTYPCEQGARLCCGGNCGSTFAMRDAGPHRDSASTNSSGAERSRATCTPARAPIFPPGTDGAKWIGQVQKTRERSRSPDSHRRSRAKKEQKKKGDSRKDKEIEERML